MKFFAYIGIGVACLFGFASCVGSGSEQPLAKGKLTNPMDVGFMTGYEVPKIASRWSKTFGLYKLFDVGNTDSQPSTADYSANQPVKPGQPTAPITNDRSWVPWDKCSVFSPRAGSQDINCDGVVDDKDVQLYKQFNSQPNGSFPAPGGDNN